ncbi:complement resistance protein TraT [Rheinheimera sp.]|uniref:complement resistance protein TraT n=1 Tax=Rheinheimera sp. TaxID=1869214 RepID=UPI00307F38FD
MSKLKFAAAALVVGALALSGCSATHTAISKRNLDVQTKMSDTIFLDPVADDKRTVFVQVRNTSDKQGLSLEPAIIEAVQSKGYRVVRDPEQANFLLQANVLQAGQTDLRAQNEAFGGGFGGALVGGAIGNQFGSGSGRAAATVGGALIGLAADALVKDVHYSIITDLQISERAKKGVVVVEENKAALKQGNSGYKNVSSTEETEWKRYQTRIMSTANQVNMEYVEAEPALIQGLVRSISGIM